MKKILPLCLVLLCSASVAAQYKLKRFEFPEFGISIPFFESAKKNIQEVGTINELHLYSFEEEKPDSKIFAKIWYYPRYGCSDVSQLYDKVLEFAKKYGDNNNFFRPLLLDCTTLPFGWTFFNSLLKVDNNPTNISRKVQAFYNGAQLLMVELITVNIRPNVEDEIFDEPGYSSILRPINLSELGLRLRVRGHVQAYYDAKQSKFFIGRCDKISDVFPFVSIEKVNGDASLVALGDLANYRNELGLGAVSIETIPNTDKLAKFSGALTRIFLTFTENNAEIMASFYYFKFNGQSYKASLMVPLVPNDDRLFYKNAQVDAEAEKEYRTRWMEMLENLEGL